ncbi:S8 family peptidase [Streptomyces sp.]|uniref:S8 family peptidase n=1 Tax=Streptomyces sp. TaxID=1931 RepID=UPI002F3F9843
MRLLARGLSAAALLLVPLAVAPSVASADPVQPTPAPLIRSDRAVTGQYIVTLRKNYDAAETVKTVGVKPLFTYGSVMRGFAAVLSSSQLDLVRRTPGVESVEENATATAFGTGTGPDRMVGQGGTTGGTRAAATSWGLDRIDQRNLPLDRQFTTAGDGDSATAYIMDTGIDYGHSEFGGRAVPGFDAIGDGRNGQDCNGHGTHVAGTVGGASHGVATRARLVSVRVLGCDGSGSWAGVIAGFDWVARNATQPAVLNASLGGDYSRAVNDAADALSDAGVLPVVAAGNSSQDACDVSPASADHVATIGATDQRDRQTSFSNFGQCLWMYAPGQAIVSARLGGGSVALDGTSMASPHAAGVALLYKASNPTASAQTVATWLAEQSTKDVLSVSGGSPNRLLFTGGL